MISRFDLSDRIALITGSHRGLGRVMAEGLADAGATVVINGRSDDSVQRALEEFRRSGYSAFGYSFDITDEADVENSVQCIERDVGPIDILVNNAGIQYRAPLEEVDAANWRAVIETNLTGAFLIGKTVANSMMSRKRGKIVNVCSLASDAGRAGIGAYTAAKGGLKMLTRAMCADWAGHNIQVNGIAPGYFRTELTESLAQDERFNTWLLNRTPAGRWGAAEELVGALVLLCSEASSFINGQVIVVDGGVLATM